MAEVMERELGLAGRRGFVKGICGGCFGTLDCSALLGADMGTPQGIKEAADRSMFTRVCPKTVVAAVTEILKINV